MNPLVLTSVVLGTAIAGVAVLMCFSGKHNDKVRKVSPYLADVARSL